MLDLALISHSIADTAVWKVDNDTTVGSDHYSIKCKIENYSINMIETSVERWVFRTF